jgi:hypothetical protein
LGSSLSPKRSSSPSDNAGGLRTGRLRSSSSLLIRTDSDMLICVIVRYKKINIQQGTPVPKYSDSGVLRVLVVCLHGVIGSAAVVMLLPSSPRVIHSWHHVHGVCLNSRSNKSMQDPGLSIFTAIKSSMYSDYVLSSFSVSRI